MVEMLYRCNILALVGGGHSPKFVANKVIIWDDHQTKIIGEFKFTTPVKNVKLRKDKIFVILEQKIFVFDMDCFKQLDTINTFENPNGIFAINTDPKVTVIAYPSDIEVNGDKRVGYVRIKSYENNTNALISAHQSKIAFLALNHDGSLLATASEKGTIIRIFETTFGNILQEVRRGRDKAIIYHICFNNNSVFIAATSNKGTVHVWSLKACLKKLNNEVHEGKQSQNTVLSSVEDYSEQYPENKSSVFKSLPTFLSSGFFKSEWSFARVRIDSSAKSICMFTEDNYLMVVTQGGWYYKAKIDLVKGGDCEIEQKENLSNSKRNGQESGIDNNEE